MNKLIVNTDNSGLRLDAYIAKNIKAEDIPVEGVY